MIIGTAGHIDHGKTTLVRALTGVDTDRLKEEKARGISIELGYAYTPLSDGNILGFVDVPGHERLVHTMAAGACGIDFALLVIAADDGVMPQTREHVAILQLFGVTRGAVALTKVDRVDDARLAVVEAEIARFLSNTAFRDAPVFRLNAAAGMAVPGIAALRAYLERVASDVEPRNTLPDARPDLAVVDPATRDPSAARLESNRRPPSSPSGAEIGGAPTHAPRLFRLAIDRVFTLTGHGTVVAGTVFSGSVRVGDNVAIFPSNIPVRVRSIHSQNRAADEGRAGERCALNVTGVDKSAIKRGDWLADPRVLSPTTRIDVRIEILPDSTTVLKSWAPVHFHHGAAHSTAHVVPLDRPAITPGDNHYAQFVLDTPICALPGDRFIFRDASATYTIGGGVVLDPFAQSRKRRSTERLRYLHALEQISDSLLPLLAESPHGIKESDLVRLTGLVLEHLPPDASTVDGTRERYVILKSVWQGLRERAIAALREFHTASPDEPGPDIGRLRRISLPQLPHDLWRALVAELARDGAIVRSDPWIHLPGHSVTLSANETALAAKLAPLIAAGRFNPPWVRDLAGTIKAPEDDVRQVLRKQVTQGTLYQVVNDLFYDRKCVDELATMVTTLAEDQGTVEAAQYRDAVGLGRKRAIQILEFFDRVGHTRRFRDSRVLRPDSSWHPR
jgi:selenocysteine-specific elongation factor